MQIWNVNVDNVVISNLIETKSNSKYLTVIRPLVLIIPEMSGCLRHLKLKMEIKIKTIKLMPFHKDDEKLLEK